jgi:hypothetical protein
MVAYGGVTSVIMVYGSSEVWYRGHVIARKGGTSGAIGQVGTPVRGPPNIQITPMPHELLDSRFPRPSEQPGTSFLDRTIHSQRCLAVRVCP